jgi:hypothetical protein
MNTDYNSSWDYTVSRSNYHFDKNQKDTPGDWFWVIGRFKNTWSSDLDNLKAAGKPLTWENRKFTMGRNGPVSLMLSQEENDVISGGGDPKMVLVDTVDQFNNSPGIQQVIDFFGLKNVKARVHIQRTGQVFNKHIDKLDDIYPNEDPKNIIRFGIMLADWEPGQFYCYGNLIYENWKAGDVHWFDWYNVPHATANASNSERYTLQVTGIKTDVTNKIISNNTFQLFTLTV